MSSADLKAVAFHEAAHAVLHVDLGYELECVTIKPDAETNSLGRTKGRILPTSLTSQRIHATTDLTTDERSAMWDNIVNLLAGEVAEARLRGDTYRLDPVKPDAHTRDEWDALGQLQSLYGVGPEYTRADRQLLVATSEAVSRVAATWTFIERVAAELLARTCLNGDDVLSLKP